jgi:ABC-type uncharacterized transport system substrate-binding protein
MQFAENDPVTMAQLSGFMQGLAQLGWTDGRNVRMDLRWAAGSVDRTRMFAKELVDLQPDVILAHTTPATAALQRETRTIPIVFAVVSDPVGVGFVAGLPRPGGNLTGFIHMEASMAGKWLELLTEIAPGVKRATIMFNPDTAPYARSYYLPSFEAASRLFKVVPFVAPVHSEAEIETVITSLGREPGGVLVVLPDTFSQVHRAAIILLAARNNVPTAYYDNSFAKDGVFVEPPPMSIASSRARSRPTFRCRHRPNTYWRSISKPPRRSASTCRRRWSVAPTRSSSSAFVCCTCSRPLMAHSRQEPMRRHVRSRRKLTLPPSIVHCSWVQLASVDLTSLIPAATRGRRPRSVRARPRPCRPPPHHRAICRAGPIRNRTSHWPARA